MEDSGAKKRMEFGREAAQRQARLTRSLSGMVPIGLEREVRAWGW